MTVAKLGMTTVPRIKWTTKTKEKCEDAAGYPHFSIIADTRKREREREREENQRMTVEKRKKNRKENKMSFQGFCQSGLRCPEFSKALFHGKGVKISEYFFSNEK